MIKYKILLLIVLAFILSSQSHQLLAQSEFVVIVNKDNPRESINKSEIRRYYFGFKTQWDNYKKVKAAYTQIPNDGFWNYMATSKAKFKSFWTKRVFSGNGVPPIELSDSRKVIDYVANNEGAIGVISSAFQKDIGANCKLVIVL